VDGLAGWIRADRDGVCIAVRLTPKGGADRIGQAVTLADGSEVLTARVKAVAEKGAANTALERLIARSLGVAPAKVAVASGHRSRIKSVHVAASKEELGTRLTSLAKQENKGESQ
jgi:uncharacterized protein